MLEIIVFIILGAVIGFILMWVIDTLTPNNWDNLRGGLGKKYKSTRMWAFILVILAIIAAAVVLGLF
jgi:hypothetical protein